MQILKNEIIDNVNEEVRVLSERLYECLNSSGIAGSFYVGYPIFERDNTKHTVPILFASKKGIFVINETEEQNDDIDGFIMRIMSESKELMKLYRKNIDKIIIYISKNEIENIIATLSEIAEFITDAQLREINSYLQNSYSMNRKDERLISNPNSLGSKIREINTRIATLDGTQFQAIHKNTNNHMRIRGLAGSGKTILLARKMAFIHFNQPNLKMAYVFYTVSLKEYITSLFINFYRDLAPNKEPNFDNIHIFHGWGSENNPGLYSYIAKSQGIQPKTYGQLFPHKDRLDVASKEILDITKDIKMQLFDHIFIDEAQDFKINFFKMAVRSLTSSGKLFYAYDELQSLSNSEKTIPSILEIFESDDESICDKIDLEISYRCPNDLLVTAHALGLGIYHKDETGNIRFINMIEDLSVWEGIGYHVESGKLDYGKEVTLYRAEDRESKDILKDTEVVKVIDEYSFEEQINSASREIIRLLDSEDVMPEDILIIDLDSINLNLNAINFRAKFIELQNELSEQRTDINLVNKTSGDKYNKINEITYTTVFRAKGNEANIVFILNAGQKDNIYASFTRNRLFTAMTRAKVRTYVYGDVKNSIVNETNDVKSNEYKLKFTYPTISEMKSINNLSKKETVQASKYNDAIGNVKNILLDKDLKDEFIEDLKKLLSQGEKFDID